MRQVQTDPVVLHRYEKHFMMSGPTLVHYFKGLHLEPLTQAKRYLVYNVDDSFFIAHRLLHLTPGTLVFADASHKPILKRSCGNPMTAYLPALGETSKALHSKGKSAETVATRSETETGDLVALADDHGTTLSGAEPGLPSDLLASTDPTSSTNTGMVSSVEGTPGQALSMVDTVAPVGAGLSGLAGLLGAAGAVAALDRSGGSRTPHGPPPVPEPAPLIVLGLGTLGLLRRRKSTASI